VEVISPSDLFEEVLEKIEEYFHSGIRYVWIIDAKLRLVYSYESPTQIRVLTRNDSLDGGVVLPGFQLPLVQLFPADA
jgi:Uma2 family endonuclease